MSEENNSVGSIDIVLVGETGPVEQLMIVVKRLANGDLHAENNFGEMVMITQEGDVKTFLDGDTGWVRGKLSNPRVAWETIGFHFGMTDGAFMDRTRNERTH